MPSYEFRCPQGDSIDAFYSMADVPDAIDCPACGQRAARRPSAPYMSIGGSSAFKLIDSTTRSAHEPQIVSALPSTGRPPTTRYTQNPLHQKLPKP